MQIVSEMDTRSQICALKSGNLGLIGIVLGVWGQVNKSDELSSVLINVNQIPND